MQPLSLIECTGSMVIVVAIETDRKRWFNDFVGNGGL
jgi:hypothetical protein